MIVNLHRLSFVFVTCHVKQKQLFYYARHDLTLLNPEDHANLQEPPTCKPPKRHPRPSKIPASPIIS